MVQSAPAPKIQTLVKADSLNQQSDEKMRFFSSVDSILLVVMIYFSVNTPILASGHKMDRPSPRYRSEYFQKDSSMNYLQVSSVAGVIPSKLKTVRRDVEICNSDACCDSNYFCQDFDFVCKPCSQCYFNSEGVGDGCTERCSLAQIQFPSLSWLSLSTTNVDASRYRQNVDMMFAVQHDYSGLLSAQVNLIKDLDIYK